LPVWPSFEGGGVYCTADSLKRNRIFLVKNPTYARHALKPETKRESSQFRGLGGAEEGRAGLL